MQRVLVLVSIAVLTLGACSSDDGEPTDSVALEDQSENDGAPLADDEGQASTDGLDEPTDQDTNDQGAHDEGTENDSSDDDPQEPDNNGTGDSEGTSTLTDIDVAQPGTWPVGDAGTVTFDVVDGQLVLEDLTEVDGWNARIDDEDHDEIDVEFVQGTASWRFEVELTSGGSALEIELDFEQDDANAGSYDIGDAGTFAFEVDGSQLLLTDLSVADGWTVTDQDEDDDEFEFDVEQADRRFEVEVELDDGVIELQIDYTVTSSL